MLVRGELPKAERGHTYMQWIFAILANTTLLSYGLQAGWISPVTKLLQSEKSPIGEPLVDSDISLIASMLCLSAIFGVFGYAYIADRYGRRVAVIAIAVSQAIAWIIKLSSKSSTGLLIARICCGIPSGGCFNVIPMYVKEISQDNIRGVLGSLLILVQNVGVLGMYAMGSYLEYYTVLWIALSVPIVTIVLMLKAPESPAFLVKQNKIEAAAATVAFLRGLDMSDKIVQNEMNSMRNEDAYYKSLPDISFISIFKHTAWRRGFILSISMLSLAGCNGNFAILTYASAILSTSGVTVSPDLQALSFPAVMLLGSIISMTIIDKLGRKLIIATGFAVTVASLLGLGSALLMQRLGGTAPSWLSVLCIILSLFAYAVGICPIPYIVMSEMFNFQIRAKVLGCIVTYAWFISFIQLAAYGPVSAAFGADVTFYGFAGINLLGLFVVLVFLPETKGKSVEEIETMLCGKK